jgi:type I restriction enzyme S subunit
LGSEASFNQATCGFVARKNMASGPYIYLLLLTLRDELNSLANGAAQQNLNVSLVRNFKIVIPDNNVVSRFCVAIEPMFEKILNNSVQTQTLTTFRNLLLPKLMSGEVGV